MNLPLTLTGWMPVWMPGWMFLLLALPVLLWALAFLLMRFSVFGVKGRIESLESQIDALQEELRTMAMRGAGMASAPPSAFESFDDVPNFGRLKKSQRNYAEPEPVPAPRPIARPAPPASVAPPRERLAPAPQNPPPRPPRRTEPRLD